MNSRETFTNAAPLLAVRSSRAVAKKTAKWMAIIGLFLAIAASVNARAGASGSRQEEVASRAALRQRLWKLDRQWLDAAQHGKTERFDRMLASQYVEVVPGGRVRTKADPTNWLAMASRESGSDFTLNNFKLMAFYGSVVLATDHLTLKAKPGNGRKTEGEILGTKVFVKEGGKWEVAAAALIPLGHGPYHLARSHEEGQGNLVADKHADLAKQLGELDQIWEKAIRDRNIPFMHQLYAPQCFLVFPDGRSLKKPAILALNANAPHGSSIQAFPDDFQLRAVYGDFAIATDRTVFKSIIPNAPTPGEYRTLKFFIKLNGVWRVAGAADVSITPA